MSIPANDDDSFKINQHHCTEALKNTCVLSLQNVNLHSPGDKDFKDVGGLDDVKETLVENLLWPAKVRASLKRFIFVCVYLLF